VGARGRRLQSCAGKKGGSQTGPSPVDRARSGSKQHLLVDASGIPLAWTLTGGNRHDVTQLIPLVERIPPVRGKPGRPRRRPERIRCFAEEPRDWAEIAAFYGELARLTDSPVVELNRAVAVAEEQGPEAGLEIVDRLALEDYRYLHSTRGELLRRLGRTDEAREAYRRALTLVHDDAERRLLERRMAELGTASGQS
jgi:tetratricopeptide (TPR) repeat protein